MKLLDGKDYDTDILSADQLKQTVEQQQETNRPSMSSIFSRFKQIA